MAVCRAAVCDRVAVCGSLQSGLAISPRVAPKPSSFLICHLEVQDDYRWNLHVKAQTLDTIHTIASHDVAAIFSEYVSLTESYRHAVFSPWRARKRALHSSCPPAALIAGTCPASCLAVATLTVRMPHKQHFGMPHTAGPSGLT